MEIMMSGNIITCLLGSLLTFFSYGQSLLQVSSVKNDYDLTRYLDKELSIINCGAGSLILSSSDTMLIINKDLPEICKSVIITDRLLDSLSFKSYSVIDTRRSEYVADCEGCNDFVKIKFFRLRNTVLIVYQYSDDVPITKLIETDLGELELELLLQLLRN